MRSCPLLPSWPLAQVESCHTAAHGSTGGTPIEPHSRSHHWGAKWSYSEEQGHSHLPAVTDLHKDKISKIRMKIFLKSPTERASLLAIMKNMPHPPTVIKDKWQMIGTYDTVSVYN